MADQTSAPPTKTGLSWPVIVLALLLVGALVALVYTWTQAQQAALRADLALATATANLAQAQQSSAAAADQQAATAQAELAAAQATAASAQATSVAAAATAQANQEAVLAVAVEEAGLQARQSAAYRLAASALAALPTQPEQSLLLAREAVSTSLAVGESVPPEISGALRQAVWANGLDERLTAGHHGPVNDVAFSPEGNRLATVGDDGTVRLWNTTSGGQLLVLSPATGLPFYSVAFSPAGDRLAAASFDQTAKIWDASTGQELLTLTGHKDWVVGIAFGPAEGDNGEFIATGSQDGTAIIWNAATGEELLTLTRHTAAVNRLAFSPQGDRLATASDDGTLILWETASGQELLTLSGHEGPVYDIAFNPEGDQLASASIDGTVRIWDSETGQEERTLRHNRAGWATSVAFNASGEWLASAGDDGRIVVWDATTGRERLSLVGHADAINGLAVSPVIRGGEWLASAGADGQVRLWRLTGNEATLGLPPLADHRGPVYSLATDASDSQLATAGADGMVKLWQLGLDQTNLTRTLDPAAGPLYAAALSPEGDLLAAAGEEGAVMVWKTTFPDAAQGGAEAQFRLAGHTGPVYALVFNPVGGQLASAGEDGSTRLWDTTSGEETAALTPEGANAPVYSLAFHPSGAFLATAGRDGLIRLWDTASSEQIAALPSTGATVRALAFHPTLPDTPAADGAGALLAIGGDDGTVRLWTVRQSIRALPGAGAAIQALAFSPDQQRLAAVDADGVVTIWSMVSGQVMTRLTSPAGVKAGFGLAFVADGEALFSGGQTVSAVETGGAVLHWDAAADELLNLYTPTPLAGLALTNNHLAVAGADGQVRLWEIEPGASRWSARLSGGRAAAAGIFTSTEQAGLTSVAVAGDYLAAGGDAGTVWLWQVESGRLRATLPAHTGPINSIVLVSSTAGITESHLITAGRDDTAKVWTIAANGTVARQPEFTLTGHTGDVVAVAVNPADEALLATASHDGTARLWNLETGEEGLTLAGHTGWVNDVAFNADGNWLATAGEDGTVRVWEVTSGKELLRLASPVSLNGPVKQVAFSPAGEDLAALTGDGAVFGWSLAEDQRDDTLTAQLLLELGPALGGPDSLAFDATGRALVTAGADGVIRFYAWGIEELLTLR
ncbi:MAG: WD40 repeat domain-containing protein [Anaerolineales bacterium]|nr:WD40 repeat domain-containing protein [Anaerolineales bacterium]